MVGHWNDEVSILLNPKTYGFFRGEKAVTNVVVFWGVQSSKKILFFQRLDRAETSYSPK